MKMVSVEEGAWIQIADPSSGELITGRLKRFRSALPFDESNLSFKRNGYDSPIRLEHIVRVFPKVILKENPKDINPSKRTKNESK